ncbi:nucleotide disphospho-sugar-binding domain-containing protein [Streptomyces sp. UG1]|uniref:nucleotide disphospho-sugar-binding domain-containing protein n=1 Tax=Streptomyces sp. UG1 TaxID=3417652 RepID=UPI003CF04587
MRVLFVPWGMPTHYFHMVPLAWAFRAAGHEVRVTAQPKVADAVRGSGMVDVTVAESHDTGAEVAALARRLHTVHRNFDKREMKAPADLTEEDRAKLRQARQATFVGEATAMADDLVREAASWRPDLVVADPMALAAPLAAHAAGAPLVHHLWGPSLLQEIGFPGCGAPTEQWSDELRSLYERFGVEPRTHHAAGTVDNCPPGLQVPDVPAPIPVRFVPYNGTGSVPRWLAEQAGRPRVCVTWGTTTTELGGTERFVVPRILEGLADHDVEVVLAVSAADRKLLGETGERVRTVEHLPLHLLLPTCDALIHQGGSGSLLTATSLGVPQVVVPTMPYLTLNARQLSRAGAGVTVDVDGPVAEQIKSAAATVLGDDTVRAAAGRLRAEILDRPAPAATVGTLEQLI